jgi:hypothetical protein
MATDPAATPNPATPPLAASTPAAPAPAATPPPAKPPRTEVSFFESFVLGRTKPGEYPVYHHSTLFYWWPVWFLGFLFALLTWIGNLHMTIVPDGSFAADNRKVETDDGTQEERSVVILPKGRPHVRVPTPGGADQVLQPKIYMARAKGMGTLFVIVLLLVIVITNISMRGLWSVFVLVVLVALSVIFAVAGWWDVILARLGQLAIYINLGGYLTIASVLFVVWFVNFFIFDRQTYMIFTPGQVRVRLEIGEGETVYDTTGMVFQKQRGDLFRHWILGFGSGDLIVRPAGQGGQIIEMPNVLRVGAVVKMIEQMVKERVIVGDSTPGDPTRG